jgi:hypothetical protein
LCIHRETFGYATQVPTNAKDKRVVHLIGKSAENGRRIAIGVLEKIDVIRGLLYPLLNGTPFQRAISSRKVSI